MKKEVKKIFIAIRPMYGEFEVEPGMIYSMGDWLKKLQCDAQTFEMYASYGIFKETK